MSKPKIWKSWERHEPEHSAYQDLQKVDGWHMVFWLFVGFIGLLLFLGFIGILTGGKP